MGLALAPIGAGVARAEERWVQTWQPADMWSNDGPTAISFGKVRPFTYLRLHGEVQNSRIYVYNPKTQNFAYVDAGPRRPERAAPGRLPERPDRPRDAQHAGRASRHGQHLPRAGPGRSALGASTSTTTTSCW